MTWRAWLLAATAAAACTDPAVAVELVYPPAPDPARPDVSLEQAVVELRLIVYELASKTCGDVALGRVSDREKDVALRTSITFTRIAGSVGLSGIPRTGAKLFVVEGFDGGGEVIAGGCAEVGDIEDDRLVKITVEPSLRMRLVPPAGTDPIPSLVLPATAPLQLLTFERWTADRPSAAPLDVTARTPTAEIPYVATISSPSPDGLRQVMLPDARPIVCVGGVPEAVVGPTEIVIRSRWADRVVRVPAAVAPRDLDRVSLEVPAPSQAPPGWAFAHLGHRFTAVAIARWGAGPEQLVVVSEGAGENRSRIREIARVPAAGVRAIAAVKTSMGTKFVTRLADAWYQLRFDDPDAPFLEALSIGATVTAAADELIPMPGCGGPSIGGLVRAGLGPYEAFNSIDGGAAEIADIARRVVALQTSAPTATIVVTGAVCIAGVRDGAAAVVEIRDGTSIRVEIVGGVDQFSVPFVGVVTSSVIGQQRTLLGAVPTATGLRLSSYRWVNQRLIPDGVIDHPLAGPPSSVRLLYANPGDQLVDSLAVIDVGGRRAVQVTLGTTTAGDEVSGVAYAAEGSTDLVATGAELLADASDDETPARLELVFAGTRGIAAYDMTRATGLPPTECE